MFYALDVNKDSQIFFFCNLKWLHRALQNGECWMFISFFPLLPNELMWILILRVINIIIHCEANCCPLWNTKQVLDWDRCENHDLIYLFIFALRRVVFVILNIHLRQCASRVNYTIQTG